MKRSRTTLFLVLVLALCLQALPAAVFAQQGEAQEQVAPAFVPGQLIISFQPGLSEEEIAAFYQEYNRRRWTIWTRSQRRKGGP